MLEDKFIMGDYTFEDEFYYEHDEVKKHIIKLKKYLENWSGSNCHNHKLKEIFGEKLVIEDKNTSNND